MNDIVLKYAKLAKLAPLECDGDDNEKYTSFFKKSDFDAVLKMIQSVQNIDTDGMPHTFSFFEDEKNDIEVFRDDEVVMTNTRDDLLSNGQSKMGYYVVPKVIEDIA